MSEKYESSKEQVAAIESNAEAISLAAYRGFMEFGEKGTVVLLRQNENDDKELATWQIRYKPLGQIESMLSDWRESGLQEMLVRYNPMTSVVCTFLYPDGKHSSFHFAPEPSPESIYASLGNPQNGKSLEDELEDEP
ncbi:MAG: hypothetical protein ACFB9N_10215 [Geitlerinemataceae cyanobacterium]